MSRLSKNQKIIDIHHHFITNTAIKAFQKSYPKEVYEKFAKTAEERFSKLPDPETRSKQLVEDMKEKGVDQILLMTFSGDEDIGFSAHKNYPKHFPGTVPMLLPQYHTDPEIMDEWKNRGAVAIKFYPGFWNYGFNDERVKPYIEKIQDLGLGIIIHFGVMKGGDVRTLWPSNPLELKPWLTNPKFEDLKFIIAHFGAGFLREVLMMGYSFSKNIAVDTSGSNDWLFNSPWIDLTQVFEKTIKALGSENVFFGTDSNANLIRDDVLIRQIGIIQDLVTKKIITSEEAEQILWKNTQDQILKQ